MKSGIQLLNVTSLGAKLKIIIWGEIGVVFNAHCSSSPHPKTESTGNITSRSWTIMPTIPHGTCHISEGMNTRPSLAL